MNRSTPKRKVFLFCCLILLVFAPTVMAAPSEEKAIVLAMFGTTHQSGLVGIMNIHRQVKNAFPDIPVKISFTSNIIRRIWRERSNDSRYKIEHPGVPLEILHVKGPLATISDLQDAGYGYIIVQPTLISSGEEFADLTSYVNGFNSIKTVKQRNMPLRRVILGRPALGTHGIKHEYRHDIEQVARSLAEDVEQALQDNRALVYMAHGNEHFSTGVYLEFEEVMRTMYPTTKTYVTMVEGFPGMEMLLHKLDVDKTEKVLLKPFMTVAGNHAKNDMAGPGSDSLLNILSKRGLDVKVDLTGLGENDKFAGLFVDHINDAAADAGLKI